MHRHLASFVVSLALLTPISIGGSLAVAPPVAAISQSCSVNAYVAQSGATRLSGAGHIYCVGATVDYQLHVHVQRCTFDFLGCKAWADAASWWDYSASYNPPINSFSGPWHAFTGITGNRYKVTVEGYWNFNYWGTATASPEIVI